MEENHYANRLNYTHELIDQANNLTWLLGMVNVARLGYDIIDAHMRSHINPGLFMFDALAVGISIYYYTKWKWQNRQHVQNV